MVSIEIYTSPTCPNCPSAKELVKEVSKELKIQAKEYSTATREGVKRAQRYGIMAVPTILIKENENIVGLRGTPSKQKLIETIEIAEGKRQPKEHTTIWQDIGRMIKNMIRKPEGENNE